MERVFQILSDLDVYLQIKYTILFPLHVSAF